MSIIVKSVRAAHILGVLIIASVFLYNLSVKSEAVQANGEKDEPNDSGALSVVMVKGNEEGMDYFCR